MKSGMGSRLPWWHWIIRQLSLTGLSFLSVEGVILTIVLVLGYESLGSDLHIAFASIVLVTFIPGALYAILSTVAFAIFHLERRILRALGMTAAMTWGLHAFFALLRWTDFDISFAVVSLVPTVMSTLTLCVYLRLLHYFDRPRPPRHEASGLNLMPKNA